jgi:hypothetical protein
VNSGGKTENSDCDITRVDNMDSGRGSSVTECIEGRQRRTAPAFHEYGFGGDINSTVVFMVSSQIYYPSFGFPRTLENGWAVIGGNYNLNRFRHFYATVSFIYTRGMDYLLSPYDWRFLVDSSCIPASLMTNKGTKDFAELHISPSA